MNREMLTLESIFQIREENEQKRIEGFFAVFDGIYNIAPGMSESIDSHAFDNTLSGDIRALINHDTTLVLGRTAAHTLELRTEAHGLWGSILINPNDQDAMNLYERVKRGDVNQCSFGFDVTNEDAEVREDGSVHWTIKGVKLYEVSVCTFPAYETTEVSARSAEAVDIRKRRFDAWKAETIKSHDWLKGEKDA